MVRICCNQNKVAAEEDKECIDDGSREYWELRRLGWKPKELVGGARGVMLKIDRNSL